MQDGNEVRRWSLKSEETSHPALISFLQLQKSFLLLWWLSLGCFISLFRFDVLLDLLELFFLLFLAFLCQFLLTLFVLVIYFSQFGILSCS